MGRTMEAPKFESRKGQEFYLFHIVQTVSEAHPASYLMITEDSFPGDKAAGA
jgi:predicted 2-oxoglutarate/Fe(II)-dependent dioxygenase YbiX